jgi:hypothetical protein
MRPTRAVVVLVATALLLCAACFGGHGGGGGGGGPAGPSGGGTSTTFVDEGPHFQGAQPAPVVVGGTTYVYLNAGVATTSVLAAPDGLTFAPTPATVPAGFSRTIVQLQDGRYRMYYFPSGTSVDVQSAISSDGLNWTVEDGIRYTDPGIGAFRAVALPTGGCRLYYPDATGITSAVSSDGLTFTSEGQVTLTPANSAYSWGPSAAAYVNGQFHMVLTRTPQATGVSELWHAVSPDGRTWTVDSGVLAANPGVPLNQPAWGINGGTLRIYYRAQPPGGSNMIGSGLIRF